MIKYSYMDTYFAYTLKHGYFYNLDPDLGPEPWTRTLDPGPGPWTLDPKNLDPEKPGP